MVEDFDLGSQLATVKICETFVCWHLLKDSALAKLQAFVWYTMYNKRELATFSRIKALCLCLPPFVFKVYVFPV